MPFLVRLAPLMTAAAFVAGCAVPASRDGVDASSSAKDCIQVTGSNICRKQDGGSSGRVEALSGATVRP